jgi:hypothetical protein
MIEIRRETWQQLVKTPEDSANLKTLSHGSMKNINPASDGNGCQWTLNDSKL